jgi:hypothetical protein
MTEIKECPCPEPGRLAGSEDSGQALPNRFRQSVVVELGRQDVGR